VGGVIYGWIARHWDELRRYLGQGNASGLIYSLGLTLLLIGVRSFGDIVLNWYVLALVVLVLKYLGVRRRAQSASVPWRGEIGEHNASV